MEYTIKDRTAVIFIDGEIDHHSLRDTSQYVSSVIEACLPKTLVLDMSGVRFMDSSGLALAIGGSHKMSELGGNIIIKNVPRQAMKVFNAAGINRFVTFENTERVV